ncbi:uncharacterized protein MCYG_03353 [Microsporum canis CBS 113480]|uniref:Uncharacterized protein n=1 Tax=Arthroderma otae (strain ATCC MYA-4605 / CBS 113480) TaxID=554155 RepID=C5FLG2_ARTOC|nr:uncharacterized protein MCYG_03353 [Microsporum canis CBS 113480]EEQ30534.1 predicted protein [Microsporum canis CBS 113480]
MSGSCRLVRNIFQAAINGSMFTGTELTAMYSVLPMVNSCLGGMLRAKLASLLLLASDDCMQRSRARVNESPKPHGPSRLHVYLYYCLVSFAHPLFEQRLKRRTTPRLIFHDPGNTYA